MRILLLEVVFLIRYICISSNDKLIMDSQVSTINKINLLQPMLTTRIVDSIIISHYYTHYHIIYFIHPVSVSGFIITITINDECNKKTIKKLIHA